MNLGNEWISVITCFQGWSADWEWFAPPLVRTCLSWYLASNSLSISVCSSCHIYWGLQRKNTNNRKHEGKKGRTQIIVTRNMCVRVRAYQQVLGGLSSCHGHAFGCNQQVSGPLQGSKGLSWGHSHHSMEISPLRTRRRGVGWESAGRLNCLLSLGGS